ncbi:scarecrow-like protein 15-like [Hibiscus syriacus]|uniref:Scarecrow-like protein 15-like n=1 Tax=Hibiscus syriacus TaxID=106335 RepID=A0A6A2ZCX1_HIBSY|nr:scarecrow-like protein 15-like [Hibiscus syriacus]
MDKEQEAMQFVGCFGIFDESYKVIIAWRKIFGKITLSLILPFSFIYLVHMEVLDLFFRKIMYNEIELYRTQWGTPKYEKLADLISDEWAYFWLFKAAYFTLYFILSLLSTAAVVYTVACIYTDRELTFSKVIGVVPKRRLRFRRGLRFQRDGEGQKPNKGNILVAVFIFLILGIAASALQCAFQTLVLQGSDSGMSTRVVMR